ncbi:MAG TPA: GAF domain-containing protein, partial [Candidatus Limnocylindrales bacterium]|nr:GAF domain-containing protein [Candidatus Limnocylindrales bacterium]
MNSIKALLGYRIGASAAAVLLVLAGGSLNASGREGWATGVAALAGVLAVAAGVTWRTWRLSVPIAAAALVLSLLSAQSNPRQGDLILQLIGLLLLGEGGAVAGDAYRDFTETIQRQARELQQKHRAFLAATSESESIAAPGDMGALTTNIAQQVGADLAWCYLASADQRQFVPQAQGIGLDHMHPAAINRRQNGTGPLVAAIESGQAYAGQGNGSLRELFAYLPDDLHVQGSLAVPMPIGDRIGGFIVLASNVAEFTDDDRRLATTLTLRAGAQLASA